MLFDNVLELRKRNVFCDDFISDSGNVFSPVFHLFVISVGDLDLLEIGVLDSLVVGHSFDDRDIDSQTRGVLFLVFPFVGHMLVGDHGFVIYVEFLQRDVLDLH
jgi:hypothetical protein